jgi:regulator of sigma E protease
MNEVLGSFWWYLVTIGVLVTFHEFGHFWVARRCGVKVLKFSIGFGKSLWSRTGRDGTVYSIGAIPLGGYVSMLDERVEDVPAELRHMAHNNKNNFQKILIAAAGPGFNFLLAVLAFWLMFAIGKPDHEPVLGRAEGLAAEAGVIAGSRVVAVNGESYTTWSEVFGAVAESSVYRRDALLRVRQPDGSEQNLVLSLSRLPVDLPDRELYEKIGLYRQLPAVLGTVVKGEPAARAGLKPGDKLLAVNGQAVTGFEDFSQVLRRAASLDPVLNLSLQRDGQILDIAVTAREVEVEPGVKVHRIGVGPANGFDTLLRHDPISALPAALRETWTGTTKTLAFLRDMLIGAISPKHLSGPITIGRVANAVAKEGLAWFLGFLAAVSIGIAILNLLPIPILDGGHILSYLIESLKGSPLSERTVIVGQYLGLGMLACLIGLAVFNDILR